MNNRLKQWLRPVRPITRMARCAWHRARPRPTYADDREDVAAMLLLGGVSRFIDVGANDGLTCSNTALAAMHGAWGICFEPNPSEYRRLQEFYCLARNIECVPVGLSDAEGTVEMRSDGLLSAITGNEDPELSALLARFRNAGAPLVQIRVETLGHWLEQRPAFQGCDLISVDVEGHELGVLHGVDWARNPKPARCFIIETHGYNQSHQWRHRDFDRIEELLARHDYRKLAASRNNTFWLHREEADDARIAAMRNRCTHYTWF